MNQYLSSDDFLEDIEEFQFTATSTGSNTQKARLSGDSPQEKEKAHGDICNWLAMGSDRYTATGTVQKTLPPGMYEIHSTNQGIVFEKINVVTDSIFKLADSTSEKVVSSIENFWSSKDKFDSFGILYKRGIILYGPPGSGKSISVMMIAHNVIERGGIVIMTKNPSLSTAGLAQIRKIQPDIPMVNVFEDMDSLIDMYGESDLLSLLDGENQIANIVNVATTNYPEKLDNRFKNRPSRFDEIYKVGMPKADIRRTYLMSVMKNKVEDSFITDEIDKWVSDSEGFSIAHLRELVVGVHCLGSKYERVLGRLRTQMKKKISSGNDGSTVGFGEDSE